MDHHPMQAEEKFSIEEAEQKMAASRKWMNDVLKRIERTFGLAPGSRILDVGAAQGRSVIAIEKLGLCGQRRRAGTASPPDCPPARLE
jgi:hypothetical protein